MRILFITPYSPSLVRVRSYGLLRQLRRDHEVTAMALCTSKQELATMVTLRNQGYDVVAVQESKAHALLRSGFALVSLHSMHAAYARSTQFIRALRNLCKQRQFDVVHVEHLRGIAAIEPLIHTYPLVWDAVDCLSLLYKQAAVSGPSVPFRVLAWLEQRHLQRYEAKMVKQLRYVLVSSERDRQALTDLYKAEIGDVGSDNGELHSTISVLPNGVDLEYFCPMQQERRRFNLVFSGKMNYHPNVATALYLYREIMPYIWQRRPEATLTIVGAEPPNAIRGLAGDPRVEVTGYVNDIRPYIRRAEVMVCPMVYCAGIQNKVLEAMALGTPVITVTQCAQALKACPGRDLLLAQVPQEFAETTLHLLNDERLQNTLSLHGRAYVEHHHEWQSMANKLTSIYQSAIAHYSNGV